MDVLKIIENLGYTTLSSNWYAIIVKWGKWYAGKTKFHKYLVHNGVKKVNCTRKTLGMAKKVCEDKADLLLNEKVTITASASGGDAENNNLQDYLDSVLAKNNFWVRGNQLVELANAKGTGAIVEYMDGEDVKLDYVQADCIFPISWGNGEITECVFASEITEGKQGKHFYVNAHVIENGKYIVYNYLYDADGKELDLPDDMVPRWDTGSESPLFQIIMPNIVNNIDTTNPMGISVYENAIDTLMCIDRVYDSYDNEFKLGKKRIFIDGSLLQIDTQTGDPIAYFDENDTMFYNMPGMDEDGKNKIQESNMELRVQDHHTALQDNLDILSEKTGFGKGYYKWDGENVQTAKGVISQNSKLYRKIKKDEIILEKVLIDMVRAILFLGKKSNEAEISINFDDSIIEDTDSIANRAMLEFNAGLIDKVMYYMKVYKLEEEQATKIVKDIESRSPAPQDQNFFPGGDGE